MTRKDWLKAGRAGARRDWRAPCQFGRAGLPQIDDLWRDQGDPWKGARTPDSRQGSVAAGRASLIPEEDHFQSFVTRETVRFLRNHGRQQPFFAICSCLKPHDPFMPAARFRRRVPR